METIKQNTNYQERSSKKDHYDKRLIIQIVKEVEEGLPRKEANRIYGLGKSALGSWRKHYGSPHYHQNQKKKSYTKLQKRSIVTAIDQGRMTIKEAQVAYSVKTERTIRDWLLRYKEEKVDICVETEPEMAKQKAPLQSPRTEALEKALQEAELKIRALNTMIDVAEEQLKIDIRKKSGAKQS